MIINYSSGIKIPGIFEGKVIKHDFSMYMGVKIWVPGLHSEEYLKPENHDKLPTARAAAPLFGNCDGNSGLFAYPEIGTLVYCFCIDGDPNTIVYFAADYEKSLNASRSYPALKIKYIERDCAWIKQGPGQIILRTPTKISPAENSSDEDSSEADITRSKVVEIFAAENKESDAENVPSFCIFSNGDIEIRGQNITFSATKSMNFVVGEKKETGVENTSFSDEPAGENSNKNNMIQFTMATGTVSIKARAMEIYTKTTSFVASILHEFNFSRIMWPLRKVLNLDEAIATVRKESTPK